MCSSDLQLDHSPVVVCGVDLGAHLGCQLRSGGGLADDAGFPDIAGQRLLAVDVLAQPQRRQRGEGVRVLAGADDDGVELLVVVEQLAEVIRLPRLREARRGRSTRFMCRGRGGIGGGSSATAPCPTSAATGTTCRSGR